MNDMKRLIAITGIVLITFTVFSATASTGKTPSDESVGAYADADGNARFTAREEDDRIAVYAGDRLLVKTETRVSGLPKIDRMRLREGIIFYSEEELKQFIEDYCS